MDGIIQVKVRGSHLSKDSSRGGVQGEANVTSLRIDFSPDWMEFEDKRITFFNALGLNPTEIKLTEELLEEGSDNVYLCSIPGAAYTHSGWFSFVIDGYVEDMRKRSVEGTLECIYAPSTDGAKPPDSDEPTEYLLSEIIVRSGPADFIEIPADGFYGIGKVAVEGDPDLLPQNIKAGVTILDVEGTYVPDEVRLVAKSLTITANGQYTVTPGSGNAGMSKVTVTADVPQTVEKIDADLRELYVTPGSSTQTFDKRNAEDFNGYDYVRVTGDPDLVPDNIRGGVTIFGVEGIYEKRELQSKSVMPGKTDKTVKADSDYDGLSSVKVYGDSDLIPQNIRKGATIFNVEGTYDTGQNFQSKDVTPGRSSIIVQPDDGYDALSDVFVHGDSNLVPANIADGVTIFGVKGNYVSPMKEITVVPSHDEQVILPASGYYGFSKITVLSSDATGDYNEGYRDAQKEAAEQIARLEEQIGQLTQDKNAAYGEGYEDGYDDGYADGAASGGGGDTKAAYYLYGTPSESGNVAVAEGDGYTLYEGAVLPKLPESDLPYMFIQTAEVSDDKWLYLLSAPLDTAKSGTFVDEYAYVAETTGERYILTDGTWVFYDEINGGVSCSYKKYIWGNFDLPYFDGAVYQAATAPIPLASNEPVAAVYSGEKLSVLPEYDESVYHTATIWRHPLTNDYYFTAGDDFVYLTNISDHTFGCNEAQHWRYSNNVWYQYSGFATTDFQFMVAIGSNGVVWTNTDILYADQSVAHAKTDPIPIYEQKE